MFLGTDTGNLFLSLKCFQEQTQAIYFWTSNVSGNRHRQFISEPQMFLGTDTGNLFLSFKCFQEQTQAIYFWAFNVSKERVTARIGGKDFFSSLQHWTDSQSMFSCIDCWGFGWNLRDSDRSCRKLVQIKSTTGVSRKFKIPLCTVCYCLNSQCHVIKVSK